jgi:hypothetical protein
VDPLDSSVSGGRLYGPAVDESIAQVQAVLDEHIGASAGRCGACGGPPGVCQMYLKASRAFAWSGHLPKRRPGATLAPAGSWAAFGWFTDLAEPQR